MPFENLFSPIQIRNLTLKNRVVMAGMGTKMACGDGREVSDQLIAYHKARAVGGVGLNTVEVCSVDTASAPKGFLSLSEDTYIPGMKKLCDAVHEGGGKIALQLWQGGLGVCMDPDAEQLYPTDLKYPPRFMIEQITEERIASIIAAFGKTARRAVEAGFDAVEFHCAHNYLPHSFLSGGMNRRTDGWGGSLENRMRFPLACLESIRSNIPDGMPLLMRIDCHDDFLPGGLTVEDMIVFCKEAKKKGVDLLNVSRGNILTKANMFEVPPVDLPHGFNVEDAARIRKETGILTMPAGRINTPEYAEEILAKDQADLVVMARAQLADPEFCNKAKAGKVTAIKYCIGCDQGCFDYFVDPTKPHISCLRNPAVGREVEMALIPTDAPKKVLVVGGGIGGIETADVLFKRGHHPIVCEASDHLGGQMLLAGVSPRKDDTAMAARMAGQNIIDEGVEVRLNTPVTPTLIAQEKPDAVVIAVGSRPIVPKIPGTDAPYVLDSHQVLGGADVPVGKIVVVGGGLVGLEVAEYLEAKGSSITVIEMKEAAAADLKGNRKIAVDFALEKADISIFVKTVCKEIQDHTVVVETEEGPREFAADAVVMAIGSKPVPSDDLKAACEQAGIPCYVIGDALQAPRRVLNAVHEAYDVALKL